ncbi:MAG TPA: hypothetical protein PK637_08175 [Flavobacteriales bacterium]|nr:hypothetical protein [Flavobacteriales bacterium]HRJ38871.1 hypothetical protein [Flavobacteriales bacterium]
MSHKSSSDLYQLIKSMSRNEKRHFRQQADIYNREGEKAYMLVFNAFDKSEDFNEDKIIKSLSLPAYPVVKARLTQLLLRFLTNLHLEKDSENLLREQFLEAKILWSRGMSSHAIKHLERLRAKALSAEQYFIALEANQLLSRFLPPGKNREFVISFEKEIEKRKLLGEKLRGYALELEDCYFHNGVFRSSTAQDALQHVFHDPEFRKFHSGTAGQHYWHTIAKGYFALLFGKPQKALELLQNEWDRFKEYQIPERSVFSETMMTKLGLLYLRCAIAASKSSIASEAIMVLRLSKHDVNSTLEFKALEMEYHMNSGNLDQACRMEPEAVEMLWKDESGTTNLLENNLAFQCLRTCFFSGRTKEFNAMANRLVAGKDACKDSLFFKVYPLLILSALDQGEAMLVRSYTATYSRKLSQCNCLNTPEITFLEMVRKLNGKTPFDRASTMNRYFNAFSLLCSDPVEAAIVQSLDVFKWMESIHNIADGKQLSPVKIAV